MKTLYSSTFLTAVLAFLGLLGHTNTPVMVVQDVPTPAFQTIIEPIGPTLMPAEQETVKIEVFNSFGCRACDLFGQGVLSQLVEMYGENEQVELHLYLVPDREDEGQLYAVRGAHCAARHDSFWEMVHQMHATEEPLSKREVDLLGQELELPITAFRACLDSEDYDEQIGKDIAYSEIRSISQKPTILVNGTILLGVQPIENIERTVNKYLNQL